MSGQDFYYSPDSSLIISCTSEDTNNHSFTETKIKETLVMFDKHLGKIKEDLDVFKKTQQTVNEKSTQEQKFLKREIKYIRKQSSVVKNSINSTEVKMNSILSSLPQKVDYTKDMSDYRGHLKWLEERIHESKNTSEIYEAYKQFKVNLMKIYQIKESYLDRLAYTNKKLNELNLNLKNDLKSHETELNKQKFCVYCHNYFYPKENEDNMCIYHPGELNYYSCKGCGADEYYKCCMKCMKCSLGCKKSKHRAGN